jgi:pimeloyl-ACP methyl ester carboxylesterase
LRGFVPRVRVPWLVLQGIDDPYGTRAQVDAITGASGAATYARLLADCAHTPHRDQEQAVLRAMAEFVATL